MPDPQTLDAATLTDEAILALNTWPRISTDQLARKVADAARDLAYRVTRAEAQEAAKGLVRALDTVRHGMRYGGGPDLADLESADTDWNEFVNK